MKIWHAPYDLKFGSSKRGGTLIKIEDEKIGVGYADLHPWRDLGDPAWEEQLKLYTRGYTTTQLAQSIFLAKLDAQARSNQLSLFEGLKIPKSHKLEIRIENLTREQFEETIDQGFETIKIKLGNNLATELEALKKLSQHDLGYMKLRFDFNHKLSKGIYFEFLRSLPAKILERVEFVEDPFPYEEVGWMQANQMAPVAADRNLSATLSRGEGFNYAVVKPANENFETLLPQIKNLGLKYLFTSNMDHPVGQMFAAMYAAKHSRDCGVVDHGVLTHLLFEKTAYSERISVRGPNLLPGSGYGIGFDDLLQNEKWMDLHEN